MSFIISIDSISIFDNLAKVEDDHVERWRTLFREHGGTVPAHAPSFRSRMLAVIARMFGSSAILLCQKLSVTIATSAASSSSGRKLRPRIGRTPSTSK